MTKRHVWLWCVVLAGCAEEPAPPPRAAEPSDPPATDVPDAGTAPPDAGAAALDAGSAATDGGETGPPGQVRGLVGVGYGGLRIASRDGGRTWTQSKAEATGGGDDYELLRAVAWASGKWLAVGWSMTTSADGVSWSPLARINAEGGSRWEGAESCGLVEALTSDERFFYAACAGWEQPHHAYRSADGLQWTDLGVIGPVGGHASLAYRDGTFYAYGDAKTSFRSTDAVTWSEDAVLQEATFCEDTWKSLLDCHDASWFDGAFFRSEWRSKITRSVTGADFAVVHDDPSNNTLYRPRALAAGFVAP